MKSQLAQPRPNAAEILDHLRHFLPSQGPLKDFIHHNTLHAFQDLNFRQALSAAAERYGAREFLPLAEYETFLANGSIDPEILERNLKHFSVKRSDIEFLRENGDAAESSGNPHLRNGLSVALGEDIDALVNPLFFRLLSQFLDQGIALWTMPGADRLSFFQCISELARAKGLPLAPLTDDPCRRLLNLPPLVALTECLQRLVENENHWESYLWETISAHAGWSGLVSSLELTPESLPQRRQISLLEMTAIKLILEVGVLSRRLGNHFVPVAVAATMPFKGRAQSISLRVREAHQIALEETFYERAIHRVSTFPNSLGAQTAAPLLVQALFCIDDRECSLRRHIESQSDSYETFSTPGFFGVDAMYLKEGELFPVKNCPAPLKPKHLIKESHSADHWLNQKRVLKLVTDMHGPRSKSVFKSLLHLPRLGLRATLRLVLDVMNPSSHAKAYGLDKVNTLGAIHIEWDAKTRTLTKEESGLQFGYTTDEMADRVARVLISIGLTKNFAPLICVIAHGSSSVNNPYFAAYDCGACSGKPGSPNARAFCIMANHPEVRLRLRKQGIEIPMQTVFVGGLHDTCQDTVEFFDTENHPPEVRRNLLNFKQDLEVALNTNALERCRRFELVPEGISATEARTYVRNRALSIFEPRPELNHANNALAIVSQRKHHRGIFLDRRAFLQSYDPALDPTGDVLGGILSALVPVCAGINLEYYFSRLDPDKYGAGTKLPHNVVGLLGVINGAEGDILTGLPTQMTEMHEPIRLLIIIEQTKEGMEKIFRKYPAVADWFYKDWVKLAIFDPNCVTKLHWFENQQWVEGTS